MCSRSARCSPLAHKFTEYAPSLISPVLKMLTQQKVTNPRSPFVVGLLNWRSVTLRTATQRLIAQECNDAQRSASSGLELE